MQVEGFIAYCLAVEAAGHQLEQRALGGHVLPEALLGKSFGELCSQAELGVDAQVPSAPADTRPDLANVFHLSVVRRAGGAMLMPRMSPLRLLVVQMCVGARTSELLCATYRSEDTNRPVSEFLEFRSSHRDLGRRVSVPHQAALMLGRERQVRRCVGVQSDLLFCDFEGRALSHRALSRTANALRCGFESFAGADALKGDRTQAVPSRIAQWFRRSP